MKRKILASVLGIAASAATVVSTHGQGTIWFDNYNVLPMNRVIWGPAHPTGYSTGAPVSDTSVVVGLYAGAGVLTDSTALQLLATTHVFYTFSYGGGFYSAHPLPIIPTSIWPGLGSTVTFQVRGWDGLAPGVAGASALWQESDMIVSINQPPDFMENGPLSLVVNLVPEPSALALAGLGAAAFLGLRRSKRP